MCLPRPCRANLESLSNAHYLTSTVGSYKLTLANKYYRAQDLTQVELWPCPAAR